MDVFSYKLGRLRGELGRYHPDFVKLLGVLYALKDLPAEDVNERYDQWNPQLPLPDTH